MRTVPIDTMEDTDEEHAITLQQIVDKLQSYGVPAERKSLYSQVLKSV